jgi:hypothetical protein
MNYKILGFGLLGLLIIAGLVYFLWPAPASIPTPAATTTLPAAASTTPSSGSFSLTPAPTTPDAFALAFYTWYLANYGNKSTESEVSAQLPNWLTPAFLQAVPTIESQTDGDAFFLAQDSPPQDSTISATVVDQTALASDVRVLFTASIGSVAYLVHLVKTGNDWRIDSIAFAS